MKRIFLWFITTLILSSVVSAANFMDFKQVQYESAVIMLTDLGIFSGYSDGTFRPNHTITRAEISKIVTLLSTDELPTAEGQSFTDTGDSWAKDYIAYCADAGIISGSNGKFRPNDKVTAGELCKMLLVVLGEKQENFTGANWAENVEKAANNRGILAGYHEELNRFVTREGAAFLINNALQCEIILGYDEYHQPIYNLDEMRNPKSLLETRFDAVLVQGVVDANSVYDLRINPVEVGENCIHIAGYTKDFQVTQEIATNNDLLGHKITIYAIFENDFNKIVGTIDNYVGENASVLDSPEAISYLYDNNLMSLSRNTRCFVNFQEFSPVEVESYLKSANTITMIDHQQDGELEFLFVSVEMDAEQDIES